MLERQRQNRQLASGFYARVGARGRFRAPHMMSQPSPAVLVVLRADKHFNAAKHSVGHLKASAELIKVFWARGRPIRRRQPGQGWLGTDCAGAGPPG